MKRLNMPPARCRNFLEFSARQCNPLCNIDVTITSNKKAVRKQAAVISSFISRLKLEAKINHIIAKYLRHLYRQNKLYTLPNLLSLYRIVVFPLLLYFILSGKEKIFAVFFAISLFTDILDGWIARTFNMQTKLGAVLDSWADTGTFILAFLGIWFFKWHDVMPHMIVLVVFFIFWILSYFVVLIKFHRLIGMHTYMFKMTGYLQGVFFILLFLWKFNVWIYYVAIVWGIIACLEEIIIAIILKKPETDLKGLFWVLRNIKK